MSQLALPIRPRDSAVFATFHADGNETAVAWLKSLAAGQHDANARGAWLFGRTATGKSHLLQAVTDLAGDEAVYLPGSLVAEAGPDVLEGLSSRRVVCLDGIDKLAGDSRLESALFALCNELTEREGVLIVAAGSAPRQSAIELPDLESRLARLPIFRLTELDDRGRVEALRLQADWRGLELPDETASFLMTRTRRDLQSLLDVLEQLDVEALRAQRRLTVPFVRDVLSS